MTTEAQLVRAGGLAPASATLALDEPIDPVVARSYQHPVMPGRVVVRLTAQNVAIGDDLEMAVLGFGPGSDRGPVAQERRRPLGFPGWCLVHDPKNARYALDVVGELKKRARHARTKPAGAKDGIEALGAQLGKTVPHFLPSFYEEAGRAFLEHGATSFAAMMFSRAREAEAVHALAIDEQHRLAAFLEFALAGAVSTKALTEYAKDLAAHHAPAESYAHFRQLCVQRTLGGMPPWAGMAKDLRKLAKAAKLDPDEEDQRFVEEIVQSPALAKAASEFWRAYATPLAALARRTPKIRGVLLDLFPAGSGYLADLDDDWFALLEAGDALRALVDDDVPGDARSSLSRAAWFDKLCHHPGRDWAAGNSARAFALLRRMAPRLIADGAAISAMAGWRLDLDLAELALELGVAVKPPTNARIALEHWASDANKPGHGRDPVRAAAHPELGPMIAAAIGGVLGKPAFDAASRGKQGFLAAKRAWLEDKLAHVAAGGLPSLDAALTELEERAQLDLFHELPDLHARLAALDLAPALARSLRAGLLDEFGWPALEAAAAELSPDGKTALTLHGGLPAAIVANAARAIAVSPRDRLASHDLVIPAKHELHTLRFIQGQFLVVLKHGYHVRGYWSSAPHDVFDLSASMWMVDTLAPRACLLTDGAWLERKQPIRAGDRVWPDGRIAASDGTTAWMTEQRDQRHIHREISASGEPGRASWAAFLEAGLGPEWFVDGQVSYVLPAPPDLDASPLGLAGGLLGLRVRHHGTGDTAREVVREVVRIDGATWSGPAVARPHELMSLPDGGLRPILIETKHRAQATYIADETGAQAGSKIDGKDARYWRGSVAGYPRGLWHALSARDVGGSQRLRAITDDDARGLIGALAGQTLDQLADAVPSDAVARALPTVANPRLLRGISGLVALAAQLCARRDQLCTERGPGAKRATPAAMITGPSDEALKKILGVWSDGQWARSGTVPQLAHTGAWFRSDDRSDRTEHRELTAQVSWQQLSVMPGVLAFLARGAGLPDDERAAIEALAGLLAGQLPDPAKLRYWEATRDDATLKQGLTLSWHAGNAYAIGNLSWPHNRYRVLEYAPDGVWKPLPQLSVTREVRTIQPGPRRDHAWSLDDAPKLAELTGLTLSEAIFLLAGCPRANDHSANFLDKDRREALGLKATQAALARDALNAVPLRKRLAAIARAGDTVESLAAAWIAEVGKRLAIPESVLADADRELQAPHVPSLALAIIAAADDASELTIDSNVGFSDQGELIDVEHPTPLFGQAKVERASFNQAVLHTMCAYLPFLYAALPVGDPLRAQAAVAYRLTLARLAYPGLLLPIGTMSADDKQRAGFDAIIRGLGGQDIPGFGDGYSGAVVAGGAIIRHTWSYGSPPVEALQLKLSLRPASYGTAAAAGFAQLARHVSSWGYSNLRCLELIRGDDFAAMMQRITDTPVPAGSWEQDPRHSAPAIVDRAAAALGLGRDAAALYLQYLTLLWPTTKNLQRWNDWKPKQLAAANAELVAHKLVLEAKRERAQRSHFLPGGWEALKPPHPPFESWKLAMYGTRAAGGVSSPLPRFAALAPFHLLFERAWARIEAGDVPKYEDVKR